MHVAIRVNNNDEWIIAPEYDGVLGGIVEHYGWTRDGEFRGIVEVLYWDGETPDRVVDAIKQGRVKYDGLTYEEETADEDPILGEIV